MRRKMKDGVDFPLPRIFEQCCISLCPNNRLPPKIYSTNETYPFSPPCDQKQPNLFTRPHAIKKLFKKNII